MIRRMEPYQLYSFSTVKDSYGELVKQWSKVKDIEVAISLLTGFTSTANNILTTSSTHIGITDSKAVKNGDKLIGIDDTFIVDYAVNSERKAMLYLKKEEAYGNIV